MTEWQQRREGWVILDDRGRRWGDDLYPTRENAERIAAACVSRSYSVKRAFRVSHLRPQTSTTARVVGEWKIED